MEVAVEELVVWAVEVGVVVDVGVYVELRE